jgi:hypothetical protein
MASELTPELEKYYDNFFDLFRSKGWKQLIEDLKQNGFMINSVEATKDVDDMYFRKGQLNVLGSIINLEDSINNAYDEIVNGQDEE